MLVVYNIIFTVNPSHSTPIASRVRRHSRNMDVEQYVQQNESISISIPPGGDGFVSPHAPRFNCTIGVLTRDTFPIQVLK